jgi:S1-C subfamily serine protease
MDMMTPPPSGEEEPRYSPTPATTPFAPPQEASGANGWGAYGYGYQEQPTIPPGGGLGPTRPLRRSRRGWTAAVMALALLLALAIGGVGGVAITNALAARGAAGTPVVIGASSAPAVTVSSDVTSLEQALRSVAAAVEPSIVKIASVNGRSEAVGSGDILTSDGYIVTNDHVVAGFTSYSVTLPATGATYSARLVGQDAQDDLAVLKIAATNLKPVAIADSSKAQVGAFAVAIGYPLGLNETATFGVVSALNAAASEAPSGPASELAGLVQTSAQLNPGNSGGALINLQGQLIGIPTLEATNTETNAPANGIGYAISSNRMEYVVKQLIASGRLTSSGQGFLGIQSQDSGGQGVQVAGFASDAAGQSPAQQAGMRAGDIITAINGKTVASGDDIASIVLTQAPGAKVSMTVLRGAGQATLTVTLGERPVSE